MGDVIPFATRGAARRSAANDAGASGNDFSPAPPTAVVTSLPRRSDPKRASADQPPADLPDAPGEATPRAELAAELGPDWLWLSTCGFVTKDTGFPWHDAAAARRLTRAVRDGVTSLTDEVGPDALVRRFTLVRVFGSAAETRLLRRADAGIHELHVARHATPDEIAAVLRGAYVLPPAIRDQTGA